MDVFIIIAMLLAFCVCALIIWWVNKDNGEDPPSSYVGPDNVCFPYFCPQLCKDTFGDREDNCFNYCRWQPKDAPLVYDCLSWDPTFKTPKAVCIDLCADSGGGAYDNDCIDKCHGNAYEGGHQSIRVDNQCPDKIKLECNPSWNCNEKSNNTHTFRNSYNVKACPHGDRCDTPYVAFEAVTLPMNKQTDHRNPLTQWRVTSQKDSPFDLTVSHCPPITRDKRFLKDQNNANGLHVDCLQGNNESCLKYKETIERGEWQVCRQGMAQSSPESYALTIGCPLNV